MTANTIRHKRNSIPSVAPSSGQLVTGELAINTYDGKVYLRKENNTVIDIVAAQTSGVYAPLISPSFTGIPIGPNPNISNNSNQLATTNFVQSIFSSQNNTLSRSTINVSTNNYSSFNISGGYTVGKLDIFQNGVKLLENVDFTASNGTSVNLSKVVPSGSSLEYLVNYSTSSYANFSGVTAPTGNFTSSLFVNSVPVSLSGHTHSSSDITNFNSSVSGLLPITNIIAGNGINVAISGTTATITSNDTRWNLFLPSAPTNLSVTGGNGQATVSWTAPTGVIAQAPVTDYREQYSTDNGTTWTTFTAAASTATSATVTGLTNGTAYVFRVAATNGVGVGAYTEASAAVTPGVPSAPTSLAATVGNAQVALAWTAPTATGGSAITNYLVQYSSNSGSSWTTFSRSASTAASATVTSLTNGTAYTFRVAAVNNFGQGAWSSASSSVTPVATTFAAIPKMTSNTQPSGTVLTFGNVQNGYLSDGSSFAWYWFSQADNAAPEQPVLGVGAGIGYAFSNQSTVVGFTVMQSRRYTPNTASGFTFSGSNDGTTWTNLYVATGLTSGWNVGVARNFTLSSPASYSRYRWIMDACPNTYAEWCKVQLLQ